MQFGGIIHERGDLFMDTNTVVYIDIDDALKRIGGNRGLYIRLLGQFTDTDHIAPLEEAINNKAKDNAVSLTHTLKGVAANLSLVKLALLATTLEHELKEGLDHCETLEDLKNAYNITLQQVSEIE
jgi:two-component system sensor histidine kinase/response regulator